jgi:hypothetical protein
MLETSKAITTTRRFEALRKEDSSIEKVIADAEVRFRDRELESDWSGQPIEKEPPSPRPPWWKAGVEYAAPITVAYARAEARTATDPVGFESFTENAVAVVAQETFFNKLDSYARDPGGALRLRTVDAFASDLHSAIQQPLKKLHRDVWKRRAESGQRPEAGVPAPVIDADSDSAPATTTKSKKRRRPPHPEPETLLAGKTAVTFGTAAEVLGMTERRVRALVEEQKLKSLGAGHSKKIEVASLRKYAGLIEFRNNPEQHGT